MENKRGGCTLIGCKQWLHTGKRQVAETIQRESKWQLLRIVLQNFVVVVAKRHEHATEVVAVLEIQIIFHDMIEKSIFIFKFSWCNHFGLYRLVNADNSTQEFQKLHAELNFYGQPKCSDHQKSTSPKLTSLQSPRRNTGIINHRFSFSFI